MLSIFLTLLCGFVRILPYRLCTILAKILGFFLFSVIRIRRDVVLDNLRKTLSSKYNEKELLSIARHTYNHYALTLLEFIRMPAKSKETLKKSMRVNGIEHAYSGYNNGRGLVFASGHTGCWELGVAAVTCYGYGISVYARPVHNQAVNTLVNSIRGSFGIQVVSTRFSLREIVQELKEGKIVGMLFDHNAGDNGVIIDFMGIPASTYKGPVYAAIKANSPILPAFAFHGKGETYDVFFHPPIYPDLKKPMNQEIKRITQELAAILESYVYKYPDQYFWFHRRWQTVKR